MSICQARPTDSRSDSHVRESESVTPRPRGYFRPRTSPRREGCTTGATVARHLGPELLEMQVLHKQPRNSLPEF